MRCRILVVNDQQVSTHQMSRLEMGIGSEFDRNGVKADVTMLDPVVVTGDRFEDIQQAVLRREPDCILMDSQFGGQSDAGVEFIRRLRCETKFDKFVWLWTGHAQAYIDECIMRARPRLLGAPGSGARSSVGDGAEAALAAEVVAKWRENGGSFVVKDSFGCGDVEQLSFKMLNELQLAIWSSGEGRTSAWRRASAEWTRTGGLREALQQEPGAAGEIPALETLIKRILDDEASDELRLAELAKLRDVLLWAIEAAR